MHVCIHVEVRGPSGVSSHLSPGGSRNQTQVFSLGDKHLCLLAILRAHKDLVSVYCAGPEACLVLRGTEGRIMRPHPKSHTQGDALTPPLA